MTPFFENLGRRAGRVMRKGKWIYQSLAGDEDDAIAAERAVGLDLAREVCERMVIYRDDAVRRHLTETGQALQQRLAQPDRTFTFGMIVADDPNAFALPGGFIFVSHSMLELLGGDRHELAALLAHEMGHVVFGHALERIMVDSVMSTAIRAGRTTGLLGGWLQRAGARVLYNAYSHEHEADCDRFAVLAAHGAGFDPAGTVRLLQKLKGFAVEHSGEIGRYLSTHPPIDDRIALVMETVRDKGLTNPRPEGETDE